MAARTEDERGQDTHYHRWIHQRVPVHFGWSWDYLSDRYRTTILSVRIQECSWTHSHPITVLKFTAKAVRRWLNDLEGTTLFIEPGSPWENGYIESFNGKLRDELLNREISTTLIEAKILIEEWRKEYNQVRPHSALNYRPPAPEAYSVDSDLTSGTINGGRPITIWRNKGYRPYYLGLRTRDKRHTRGRPLLIWLMNYFE